MFILVLMIANLTANTLVIYILIKTKQILHITYKLIFMLGIPDLLLWVCSQNLFLAILFQQNSQLLKPFYLF